MSILSTYALRTGSVAGSHAGLRTNSIDFVGSYDATSYGPSEIWCVARSALAGRYCRTSLGAGENAGRVSMSTKYVAGWVSVNTTVWSSLATTPGRSVFSM